jgi:hypothetical protein
MKKQTQSLSESESNVEEQMRSAVRTLRRMPPVKVQGYYSAWPDIVRDDREIMAMAKEPLRVRPSAHDIQELEERRLLWARANRIPWKMVCGELGVGRTKAWEIYKHTLGKIAKRR